MSHIGCGLGHSLAVAEGGRDVYSWGWGAAGQLGRQGDPRVPSEAGLARDRGGLDGDGLAVAGSRVRSCDVHAACLSRWHRRRSAICSTTTCPCLAGRVDLPPLGGGTHVVKVSAGRVHSVALLSDGTLLCWVSGVACGVMKTAASQYAIS